ncbi:hypothetical protein ACFQWB_01050 [Paenibacillus thermoaerophilus]|uniref:Uncharacterized protein n=1 Tax=Paenibacillus thermoaerophilus TaxID=1215385 RepID=A0ABW2UX98_9BACL|nr:hypothetical protein [Paenibacillus thermoaerophilus]TMV18955.1 hypothetical protein FE781_00075 [Paenibacillus thermoaerophilus]
MAMADVAPAGGLLVGLIVLFAVVGAVCWLLFEGIRRDSWAYDRAYVWKHIDGWEKRLAETGSKPGEPA